MTNTQFLKAVIFVGLISYTSYLTDAFPNQLYKRHIQTSRCLRSQEDMNLPHKSDCIRYYRCVYGKKVPKICPDKMLFNPSIGNCDLYYNVDCQNVPVFDKEHLEEENKESLRQAIDSLSRRSYITSSTTFGIKYSDTSDSSNKVVVTEDKPTTKAKFVYFPHATDSSAYYKFQNGVKQLLYCADGMQFNFDLEVCVNLLVME